MEIIKEEYKNHQIIISYNENPFNPRENDNLGTILCVHKKYSLGDKVSDFNHNNFDSWEEIEKWLKKEKKAKYILPVYMYDHSAIALSTNPFSCPWDSGRVGFIYLTKEKFNQEYGNKTLSKKMKNIIKKVFELELKEYQAYINVEMYEYAIPSLGECCGSYMSPDQALTDAKIIIDNQKKVVNEK